jgi:hypothetical protein
VDHEPPPPGNASVPGMARSQAASRAVIPGEAAAVVDARTHIMSEGLNVTRGARGR